MYTKPEMITPATAVAGVIISGLVCGNDPILPYVAVTLSHTLVSLLDR